MKTHQFSIVRLASAVLIFVLATAMAGPATTGELKLEAHLIWGTNDDKSPDRKHKPVDEKVEKKLKKLPFKWQHYYEVCGKSFSVVEGQTNKVDMSKECKIQVRNLGKNTVEIQLYGKGELVSKITQCLPKDECIVTGGNAANWTAWFVVLRQAD